MVKETTSGFHCGGEGQTQSNGPTGTSTNRCVIPMGTEEDAESSSIVDEALTVGSLAVVFADMCEMRFLDTQIAA